MPLRALLDHASTLAPLCDDALWEQLSASFSPNLDTRERNNIIMQTNALESRMRDLFLKTALVQALAAEGFTSDTEVAGDGWRADVLAEQGPERVAFEVQWSAQDAEETLRRSPAAPTTAARSSLATAKAAARCMRMPAA